MNLDLNEDLDLLENIDFAALLDVFRNLFTLKKLEDFEKAMKSNKGKNIKNEFKNITKDFINYKKMKEFSSDLMNLKKKILYDYEDNKDNTPLLYKLSKNEDDEMINDIKRSMNNSSIIKMNLDNYKKYHNLQLALEATKDSVNKMKTNNISNSNDYKITKKINRSISLLEKKYSMNLNDNLKKCFFFKYKNLARSNSTKLFTKNELINFNYLFKILFL